MNRLQSELHRLYLFRATEDADVDGQSVGLIEPVERVRAVVMELTGPPSWEVLSRVWQGVQTELDLPAPAIAVSGIDGLQLGFSLAKPIAVAQAHVLLGRLRLRFLPDIDSSRLRLMPVLRKYVVRTMALTDGSTFKRTALRCREIRSTLTTRLPAPTAHIRGAIRPAQLSLAPMHPAPIGVGIEAPSRAQVLREVPVSSLKRPIPVSNSVLGITPASDSAGRLDRHHHTHVISPERLIGVRTSRNPHHHDA